MRQVAVVEKESRTKGVLYRSVDSLSSACRPLLSYDRPASPAELPAKIPRVVLSIPPAAPPIGSRFFCLCQGEGRAAANGAVFSMCGGVGSGMMGAGEWVGGVGRLGY